MASVSSGYRFFVGIGAQRSGTTWLGQYLREHPDVGFSPLKEIRFFDSKYVDELKGIVNSPLQKKLATRGLIGELLRRPFTVPELAWHLRGIQRHDNASYQAFMRVLARGRKIGGEISPSYALLDEPAIREMDELLDHPRYFLSLRNPADRLRSEASFRRSRLGADGDIDEGNIGALVARRLEESPHLNFEGTVERYDRIVGPDRFKVYFYEDLFDPDRQQAVLDGITSFLGIAPKPGDVGKRVNASPKHEHDETERQAIVDALAGQYAFAKERFGDALPANWKADLARLG
ncbi:MAG: sulfotransferase [Pseudomonadota bacterium]